ncbi:MAG TPA: DinB family protein [Candidatus Limnocylindria bacterium]|nr:DinB family protein [Candidatus Limnocylindria bacterium]
MLRQLRHDVWATEQLLAHCRALPGEQLERTLPGTYGTVRATLAHIVSADEGYLIRLLGTLLHDRPFRPGEEVTLDELETHLAHVRDGVERLFASGAVDGDRVIGDTPLRRPGQPRFEMAAWVPITQFVHHGNDHRSQIATILSTNGVPGPDLQVWPYATALGATHEAEAEE